MDKLTEELAIIFDLISDFEEKPLAERRDILKRLKKKHDKLQTEDLTIPPATYFTEN